MPGAHVGARAPAPGLDTCAPPLRPPLSARRFDPPRARRTGRAGAKARRERDPSPWSIVSRRNELPSVELNLDAMLGGILRVWMRQIVVLVAFLSLAPALARSQMRTQAPLDAALDALCDSRPVVREAPIYDWLLEWTLGGAGAHRELRAVSLPLSDAAGEASPPLQLVLLVPIPPEAFADPYELDRIARRAGTPSPQLFGYMDLEAVASAADEAVLAVPWAVPAEGESVGPVAFSVPLHSRSPRPLNATEAESGLDHRLVELAPPLLLAVGPMRCRLLGGASGASLPARLARPIWRVPAASAAHARAVDLGAAFSVLLLGAGYVWVMLRGGRATKAQPEKEK